MSDLPGTPPSSPPLPPAKRKRLRPPSRNTRWMDAVGEAQEALSVISGQIDTLEQAMQALQEVQSEYSDWKDNMPENLASSPLGEKLEEVCGLDLESAADAIRQAVDEVDGVLADAEGIELPQGFGRD